MEHSQGILNLTQLDIILEMPHICQAEWITIAQSIKNTPF